MKAFIIVKNARRRALTALSLLVFATGGFAGSEHAVLPELKTITTVGSTVPENGDQNPYGMAQVKRTVGNLRAGHILISNFNNAANQQGTGTTIVDLAPDGALSVFATLNADDLPGACPGGIGLTTALTILEPGWVIVGSLPTVAGNPATMRAGCLIVIDSLGKPVETFYGSLINGPWDMTAFEGEHEAKLFVTNVLDGTVAANGNVVHGGTVTRLNLTLSASSMPVLESITIIAAGFPQRTDPAALVIGATGVALHLSCASDYPCAAHDDDGALLYVADALSNRIAVIDHPLGRTRSAGIGKTLSAGGGLNDPLGLIIAPNGDLLAANGGNGYVIEITPAGAQVAERLLDNSGSPPGSGALFGLVFDPAHGLYYVDDAVNTERLLH